MSHPHRPVAPAFALAALAALAGLVACTPAPTREEGSDAYHPQTVRREDVRARMDEMAIRLVELAATTADPSGDDPQERVVVLGQLTDIENEARAIGPDFMASLLHDIDVAREFARREPANYVPANRLVQSCLSCHRSL